MDKMEGVTGKVDPTFWRGKKVFLTGHTGFKGSWISLWLQSMGADVKGYALKPGTHPALFNVAKVESGMTSEIGDILDLERLKLSMTSFDPDVLIHMAAQSLVRLSYSKPIDTYATNVMGTVNVLEAARCCANLRVVISVTTDKCYENKEWEWGYRENEPLGGHDPYSSSKGCAELVTSAYRRSFFNQENSAKVASVRAGNVIGGGDWAVDRLIPDIIQAFGKEKPVIVRNPKSTRPWQHVLEPLSGYLVLAQQMYVKGERFAEPWNFGPRNNDCKPVNWILDKMIHHWGKGAKWQLDKGGHPHEAGYLKLDCSKAETRLNWTPKWSLDHSLKLIVEWYQAWMRKEDMRERCLFEIQEYTN